MKQFLLKLARTRPAGKIIGWLLTNMSFVIPGKRLRETETLIAFHHPQPSYPTHILLLPKRPYASLQTLNPNDTAFLTDLFTAVQSLVAEFQLAEKGYRLISNGGDFQDVEHLHFHLISDKQV